MLNPILTKDNTLEDLYNLFTKIMHYTLVSVSSNFCGDHCTSYDLCAFYTLFRLSSYS